MHSWRLFILVCLLPALAALVGVVFMPESPRFLLEVRPADHSTERFLSEFSLQITAVTAGCDWSRMTSQDPLLRPVLVQDTLACLTTRGLVFVWYSQASS